MDVVKERLESNAAAAAEQEDEEVYNSADNPKMYGWVKPPDVITHYYAIGRSRFTTICLSY